MKKYENPTMEMQKFNGESVVTGSGGGGSAENAINKWNSDGGATVTKLLFGDLKKYSD